MTARETSAVMSVLNADGQNALFVGGCVRNELLGQTVDDIDIATKHTPDRVQDLLNAAGIKTIPTGIDHGTITAISGDRKFEITTLRKDVETDGRHATVDFSEDWVEDAKRRDFTINTLMANEQGHIFDPLEQGLTDLENHRIVFVGNPDERIREDYLRILRFFRFYALYGKGDPDPTALEFCRKYANKIETLSRERITQEFFKILLSKQPVSILNLMIKNNILEDIFESKSELMKHTCQFQERYGLVALSTRLLLLKNLEKYLLIPKVFQRDIESISQVLNLPDLNNDHAVKVAVYKHGRVATAQALMIELAQDRVMNGYAPSALKIVQNWDIPSFPVSGEDLIAQGIKPGPELGQLLDKLENWWISLKFEPSKEQCLAQLEGL